VRIGPIKDEGRTAGANELPEGVGLGVAGPGFEESEEEDGRGAERTWFAAATAELVETVVTTEFVDPAETIVELLDGDAWVTIIPSGPINAAPSMIIDTATASHRSLRDSVMGHWVNAL